MNYFDVELANVQSLIEENKLKEAVNAYHEILNDVSEDDEVLLHVITKDLGFLYYELEDYEQAIDCLLTVLNQNFDDSDGRANKILGFSYSQQEKYDFAVEYLEEATFLCDEETEEYAIIKFELGKAYIELKDYVLAIAALQISQAYFTNEPNHEYYGSTTYYLGFAYYLTGDLELADEYFDLLVTNESLSKDNIAHGYYGKLFIAKSNKDAENMVLYAGKLMELIPNFYDRETIMYFTVLAYQYQNSEQQYLKALEFFMTEYPAGKYSDQYNELQEFEFKIIEI